MSFFNEKMTGSQRIIVNTIAGYGRSLLGLILTLYSARWVLMALGASDFGLFSIIETIVAFIAVIGDAITAGVTRFYGYSIGEKMVQSSSEYNDEMKRWFNTAVVVHIFVPLVLVAVGYPIGCYLIEDYLSIAPERVSVAIIAFRLTLLASFVNMALVPFVAMYSAYQLLVELSIFGVVSSFLVFMNGWLLLRFSGDRLFFYAVFLMAMRIAIPLILSIRAFIRFPSCRISKRYLFDFGRFKELLLFSWWEFLDVFGTVGRKEGTAIAINRSFGLQSNTAFGIANAISVSATSLSNALSKSIIPAINTKIGAGEIDNAFSLAFRGAKFCSVFALFFAIPLFFEMETVLSLWLVSPPQDSVLFSKCLLACLVIDALTCCHPVVVSASGKNRLFRAVSGIVIILTLPVVNFLIRSGTGVASVAIGYVSMVVVLTLWRLVYCRRVLNMSVRYWLEEVFVPMIILFVISFLVGLSIYKAINFSYSRIIFVCVGTFLSTALCCWFIVIDKGERNYIISLGKRLLSAIST